MHEKWYNMTDFDIQNDVILRSYSTTTLYMKSPTLPKTQGTIAPSATSAEKKATTNLLQSRPAIRLVFIALNIA